MLYVELYGGKKQNKSYNKGMSLQINAVSPNAPRPTSVPTSQTVVNNKTVILSQSRDVLCGQMETQNHPHFVNQKGITSVSIKMPIVSIQSNTQMISTQMNNMNTMTAMQGKQVTGTHQVTDTQYGQNVQNTVYSGIPQWTLTESTTAKYTSTVRNKDETMAVSRRSAAKSKR